MAFIVDIFENNKSYISKKKIHPPINILNLKDFVFLNFFHRALDDLVNIDE